MRKIILLVGIFCILLLSCILFFNIEEDNITVQDLVDREIAAGRGERIVAVGPGVDTRGLYIPKKDLYISNFSE